ncbi:LolA family protein [Cryobacterium psychrophilum]|uniref:Outer membrane lipoprotein carrier protein LolA n=1 Tax=Cryobacterium psychrophilum TaxID=41988 RepID=A0A4Y8KQQ9_9MICO|nr:DUF2092 domain-containing protein [Cryobacterium psychrophilum]TDW28525.1 outer membrane lipoprotein-sorting protein [Cryobacterium psychrophilum]TFD80475.1 outer membrane lipoprotein carrier protein LolA [Cryobacterium psychrophilum]
MPHKSLKWLPAVIVPAVIVVGVITVPLQAGAAVDLPDKTPKQVLLMVSESTVTSFSGTVDQSSNLGLPDVDLGGAVSPSPSAPGGTTADASSQAVTTALELLTGSHTARIYADGPGNVRVQVLDRLAERDLISNGTDAWFYESDTNAVTHLAIPAHESATPEDKAAAVKEFAPGDLGTPAALADRFLSDLDPSTTVSVGNDTRVAGRTVYDLVLTPTSTETLVRSVSIAVDSETGMPLRVTVQANGQNEPAFEVGFTKVDFSAPSADLFEFTPPANATVTEQAIPAAPGADHMTSDDGTKPLPGDLPVVTGTGWDAVMELPAASVPEELTASPLFTQFTTKVEGGRTLSTSLVNILITTDGRILAGSVPIERLQAVATAP